MKIATEKRLNRSFGGNAVVSVILILVGAFMFIPMWYSVVNAFKPPEEIFVFPPRLYVINPTFANFKNLSLFLSNLWVPFGRYVFNSIFVSVVSTLIAVFFGALAAYAFAKHDFLGKKAIWSLIMVTLLFSGGVSELPTYIVKSLLGLIDTLWVFILPSVAVPLYMFLLKQFMEQIPNVLIEAAKIDGAKDFNIFCSIILPNIKAAWMTVAVLMFQTTWSAQSTGLVYAEEIKLLPTVLGQVTGSGMSRTGASAAAAMLMLIPPVLAFILTQSKMMQTMAHSGIKD